MRGIVALLFVLYGASAFAADMPLKAAVAPTLAAPVEYMGGFFVGLEGGYGENTGNNGIAGADFGDMSTGAQGAVFGGYAGWGQRFGNFYGGFVGNWDWSHISGSAATPANTVATVNTNWLASVRARVGYFVATNSLLYGTFGWGWANSSMTATDNVGNVLGSGSAVNSGFTWGGGIETPFIWPAVRLQLQYLRYDLGTNSVPCDVCGRTPILFTQKDTIQDVTLGLHYSF